MRWQTPDLQSRSSHLGSSHFYSNKKKCKRHFRKPKKPHRAIGFHREFHRKVSEAYRGSRDQEGRRGRSVEQGTQRHYRLRQEILAQASEPQSWAVVQNRVQKWVRCGRGSQNWSTCKSTSSKFGKCNPRHLCKSGQTSFGDVFRRGAGLDECLRS